MLLLWWAATFFYLFLLFCLFVQAFMSALQSNTYSRFKLFINSLIFLFWTFFPFMKHYNATNVKPTSTDINRSAAVDRRSLTTRTTETTELREGWAEINLECEAPVYVTMQMHTVSVQPLCFRTVHSFSLSRSSVSRMFLSLLYLLQQVLGSGPHPHLFDDLLVQACTFVLQFAPSSLGKRVTALR